MTQRTRSLNVVCERMPMVLLCFACCTCAPTCVLQAQVTFDWAIVGDPGNAPDGLWNEGANPNHLRFGAVDYSYRISKHEVTNDQFVAFLNAVDAMGVNPHGVYKDGMAVDPRGGIVFDAGEEDGSKYSAKNNMGNKPVNYVTFFDAMRFVNWLENGQPIDGSGTETGAYAIGNGASETRDPGATFFVPSEDEWYKAAYYDPRGASQGGPPGDDNYWFYPTKSDSAPVSATANAVGDISNPGANVANYGGGANWNGVTGNPTTVGSAGPESASYYGTFDQGGNMAEMLDATMDSTFPRVARGGSWIRGGPTGIAASARSVGVSDPTVFDSAIGFRVAAVVPEPSTSILALLSLVGVIAYARRSQH